MPGISLISGSICRNDDMVSQSLSELYRETFYTVEKIISEQDVLAAFSGYEGYPQKTYRFERLLILIEGIIYNRSEADIQDSLIAIARTYEENGDYYSLVKEFIDVSDGDFNIVIYLQSAKKIMVFNDRWGRLASYYYSDGQNFLFARELKFLLPLIPQIEFDRLALAEFMVFEFYLGEKTLIKGINKTMPSSMFTVDLACNPHRIEVKQVLDVNFEEPARYPSREESIAQCRKLLLQSTADRVNKLKELGYHLTADVSGGFDTRAIFASLHEIGADVDFYTTDLSTGDESEYARRVTALYNKKLIKIVAEHNMDINQMSNVIYKTDCTVNGLTTLYCYSDNMARFNRVERKSAQMSGHGGGDFIKRIPLPRKSYRTIAGMIEAGYLVGFGNVEKACHLMGIEHSAFSRNLIESFDNQYPETTMSGKMKHWHFEYEYKLVSFGEDRMKSLIWTVNPLWSKDFYSYATSQIPDKYGAGTSFYFQFLRSIAPRLLDVPIFSTHIVKDSRASRYWKSLLSTPHDIMLRLAYLSVCVYRMVSNIKRFSSQKITKRGNIGRIIMDKYKQLGQTSGFLGDTILNSFIEECPVVALYRLLTLILYFQEVEKRYPHKVSVK